MITPLRRFHLRTGTLDADDRHSAPTRPRRSRARRFLPLALAAWLVLEIWLLTMVASAAGGLHACP
ncbi:hypothetical protein SMICM304S_11728 [Streptomyces microflavus]